MDTEQTFTLLMCAAACAAISMTVTMSSLFESFREYLKRKSKLIGTLVTCPYCCSHWVAFGLVAYFQPRPVQTSILVADLFLSAFAVVALTAPFIWVIYQVYKVVKPKDKELKEEKLLS